METHQINRQSSEQGASGLFGQEAGLAVQASVASSPDAGSKAASNAPDAGSPVGGWQPSAAPLMSHCAAVKPGTRVLLLLAVMACALGDGAAIPGPASKAQPSPQKSLLSPNPAQSIGVATMQADGTIVMDLRAGVPATLGDIRLVYGKDHKQYQESLKHLGVLRLGETKNVPLFHVSLGREGSDRARCAVQGRRGPGARRRRPPMIDTDPSHLLNQTVTLVGIARDAASGAVVLLSDGTPVYIKGLPYWEDRWNRKRIKVTGILRDSKVAPDPEVNDKGVVSHGMHGRVLVLENAIWEVLP